MFIYSSKLPHFTISVSSFVVINTHKAHTYKSVILASLQPLTQPPSPPYPGENHGAALTSFHSASPAESGFKQKYLFLYLNSLLLIGS